MRCGESKTGGFSLVELTLAIGIAAFCLIAVFGLVPVGVQTNRNATSQMSATSLIAAAVADLRATPKANTTSTQFGITFGTNTTLYFDGSGQFTTLLGTNSRYQLSLTWYGSTGLRYADLKVTWPAPATSANASGSTETFAAFDRN
jgi:type II secretory pathway pseudopilin PulG